jgi:hypothetical protein
MEKSTELCIPRVSVNITKEYIFEVLRKLKWGYIVRIHEIPSKGNIEYKRIIIRIQWNTKNEDIKKIYERIIMENEPIYIVYEMPFYWKIVKNQSPQYQLKPPPAYTPKNEIKT